MSDDEIPIEIVRRRGKKPMIISDDIVNQVKEYSELGLPMKYIATLSGISIYHVKRVLNDLGLYINKYTNRVKNPLKE